MNQLMDDEPLIWVRRQWNDWRRAQYRLSDISGLHWDDVSGGIQARANRSYLCGYVWCNRALDGEVAHSCQHGEGPHDIKVCILKKDNSVAAYQRLIARHDGESRLSKHPFAVDLGDPEPDTDEVQAWLDGNKQRDRCVRVRSGWWKDGFGRKLPPTGDQFWFASSDAAAGFASYFSLRNLGHQNQARQVAAATFVRR